MADVIPVFFRPAALAIINESCSCDSSTNMANVSAQLLIALTPDETLVSGPNVTIGGQPANIQPNATGTGTNLLYDISLNGALTCGQTYDIVAQATVQVSSTLPLSDTKQVQC